MKRKKRMTEEQITKWVKELISADRVHEFYIDKSIWKPVRAAKLAAAHYECERCRTRGKLVPATVVHHKKYLRRRPDLAVSMDNLEALCDECHWLEHHPDEALHENEKW